MNITILSLSSSETSVGRTCAKYAKQLLSAANHGVELIDIRSLTPVWVDNRGLSDLPPRYRVVESILQRSDGVILAHPVYCYSASSPAKAITELFGNTLKNMPVAIIAAAGSLRSHLAVGDLMLSMMFEQSTICFPKFVMATKDDLDGEQPSTELAERMHTFGNEFVQFALALRAYRMEVEALHGA
jgi:NAD(P)H-dependent FMN reductase